MKPSQSYTENGEQTDPQKWTEFRQMRIPDLHAEIARLREQGPAHELEIAEKVAAQRGYPYNPTEG